MHGLMPRAPRSDSGSGSETESEDAQALADQKQNYGSTESTSMLEAGLGTSVDREDKDKGSAIVDVPPIMDLTPVD